MDYKIFEEIVNEIIEEAKTGEPFIYNIGFVDTVLESNKPYLRINDKPEFIELLYQYILKAFDFRDKEMNRNDVKKYIAFLFSNMSYTDLMNPLEYIKRYTDYYDNPMMDSEISFPIFENDKLIMENRLQSKHQETPYCFSLSLEGTVDNETVRYRFPNISYGISNGVCYVYTAHLVLKNNNMSEEKENAFEKYNKKINRLLYKVNEGVFSNESDEYKAYKDGLSDYYPENISDVSPSFVVAFTCFLNQLKSLGISDIKIITFLPIRYNAKEFAIEKKVLFMRKKDIDVSDDEKILRYKHKFIQNNLTEKFIRTFYRLNYHFNNIEILSEPFIQDEYVKVKICSFDKGNNDFLNKFVEAIELSKEVLKK